MVEHKKRFTGSSGFFNPEGTTSPSSRSPGSATKGTAPLSGSPGHQVQSWGDTSLGPLFLYLQHILSLLFRQGTAPLSGSASLATSMLLSLYCLLLLFPKENVHYLLIILIFLLLLFDLLKQKGYIFNNENRTDKINTSTLTSLFWVFPPTLANCGISYAKVVVTRFISSIKLSNVLLYFVYMNNLLIIEILC